MDEVEKHRGLPSWFLIQPDGHSLALLLVTSWTSACWTSEFVW